MNSLITNIQFGLKKFKNFRKTLIHDYKWGKKHDHRNPHAIPLQVKQELLKAKKGGDWKKIRQLQRQSLTPFGRFTKRGFIFQKDKLPMYEIPNIQGFELKPYVQYLTPLLPRQLKNYQQKVNEQKLNKLKGIGIIIQMYVKQKNQNNFEKPKLRYPNPTKNYEVTPQLLKSKDLIGGEKENNINHNNHTRKFMKQKNNNNEFNALRSMELPKLNPFNVAGSVNNMNRDESNKLMCSQQFINFRQKNNNVDKYQSANFSEQMTFGQVNNKKGLLTSRQFIQEKKLKNDIIDEISGNRKNVVSKSMSLSTSFYPKSCINHQNKQAKYRLICELTDDEQQVLYCSKCAINLVQQGFNIQQIINQETVQQNQRIQQVNQIQNKLKYLEQMARNTQTSNNNIIRLKQSLQECHDRFDYIQEIISRTRASCITELSSQVQNEEKQMQKKYDAIQQLIQSVNEIRHEIKTYKSLNKFTTLKKNQFQFLNNRLNNQTVTFQQFLNSIDKPVSINFPSIPSAQVILENIISSIKNDNNSHLTSIKINDQQNNNKDFLSCSQGKQPFRILFPSNEQFQDTVQRKNDKINIHKAVRQFPTFGQYRNNNC